MAQNPGEEAAEDPDEGQLSLLARRLLSEAALLAESEEPLDTYVRAFAERFAENFRAICVVFITSTDGEWLEPAAVAHPDPEVAEFTRQLLASAPMRIGEGISGKVAQIRETVYIPEAPREQFEAMLEPKHLPVLDRIGLHSILVAPLIARGEVLGTLTTARDATQPPFTQDERFLVEHEAAQLGLAILNDRVHSALAASEGEFRTIFDQAPIGISLATSDGKFLHVNPVLCEILGCTAEELEALDVKAITHRDDLFVHFEEQRKLDAGEINSYQMEKRLIHKDGHPVWVLVSVSPVLDTEGKRRYDVRYTIDITRRKEQERMVTELSTPTVQLWPGIVLMPIVGVIDAERATQIMEHLLAAVANTEARVAILDITGVPGVDTVVANHVLQTVRALRMLGALPILTGITPDTARTVTHLGVDIGRDVITTGTLADALARSFHHLGFTVTDG